MCFLAVSLSAVFQISYGSVRRLTRQIELTVGSLTVHSEWTIRNCIADFSTLLAQQKTFMSRQAT